MSRKSSKRRSIIINSIILLFFAVFCGILLKLQVIDYDAEAASNNAVSSYNVTIDAARGEILDRNGNALITNRQGNSIVFNAAYFPSSDEQKQRNKIIYSLIKMFDENGAAWTDNLPIVYDDSGNPVFAQDRDKDIKWLKSSDMLDLNSYATAQNCMDALIKRYKLQDYSEQDARKIASVCVEMKKLNFSKSNPYVFAEDVSTDLVSKIKENSNFYKGVDVDVVPYREYTDGTIAPHILGRVTAIDSDTYKTQKEKTEKEISKAEQNGASEEKIEEIKRNAYTITDDYGQSGIELAMEGYLRGTRGVKTVSVDADGKTTEKTTAEPQQGNNVILTIDKNLQLVAQQALQERIQTLSVKSGLPKAASVVVLDVNSGEVLACANYPSYNNTTYKQDYASLNADTVNTPLFNRALMSAYAPGSTFKPCIASGALEEGVITKDTQFTCSGTYTYLEHTYKCLGHHGSINVITAIEKSCNIFFYETGKRLGIDKIDEYAKKYGLGQKTGVEIPEVSGQVASPEYRESKGGIWYAGDTVQTAIGQSDNQFTPIQLANYVATIANGGTRYVPHFVKSVMSYDYSKTVLEKTPEIACDTGISENTINIVKQGMWKVANEGSCKAAFASLPVQVAAKTGTSQVKKVVNGNLISGNNGFLISFAPYENPEIAVAVCVESADKGVLAAGVAAKIYDYYFNNKGVKSVQSTNQLLQ